MGDKGRYVICITLLVIKWCFLDTAHFKVWIFYAIIKRVGSLATKHWSYDKILTSCLL